MISRSLRLSLSSMMFLEFFVWGCWFVTMGTYLSTELGANGAQIGKAYITQALGAIIAPFVFGLVADRLFAAQRVLGVLHLAGAGLMYMAARAEDFATFYPYILIYMIIYMPTLALANSVSFRHLTDPSRQFPSIRIWGTIGWIAAGMLISYFLKWENAGLLRYTFYLCAATSVGLGLFAFFLPHTPPKKAGGDAPSLSQIIGLDSLSLLKDRNYLVFFLSSVLICIPLAFYYQNANLFLNDVGMQNAAGNMTWGQVSEILFLLALPIFLKRYGLKITLLVGMLAWVVRYAFFAYGDADSMIWMLFLGIILHGICYDFFFVSGQIYTDHKAGEAIKNSAQGLITLATYGVGMLIGFWLAGRIYDWQTLADGSHNWQVIWLIPSGIALVVLIFYLLVFKNEKLET